MADLCTLDDVAHALGKENAGALSAGQQARAVPLIARLSRLFANEAQRPFAPGTSTARLRVINGSARCAERPSTVTEVVDDEGVAVTDFTVKGHEVVLNSFRTGWSDLTSFEALRTDAPDFVTVTYQHTDAVPAAVSSAIAETVARYLRVDATTLGAGAGVVTDMAAGDARISFAEWTTRNAALSEGDCELARSYRLPGPSAVIGT